MTPSSAPAYPSVSRGYGRESPFPVIPLVAGRLMRHSILIISVLFSVSGLFAANAFSQSDPPRYSVTDLGDLGGGEAVASAINSSGQIVGFSYLAGHTLNGSCDERRGFLYADGSLEELVSLPGTKFASASAISDEGDIAGTNEVYVPDTNCPGGCFPGSCGAQTPTLIHDGQVIDLSEPPPTPWYAGVANDVNNLGQVVGWSRKSDLPNPRTWHGYLWENGMRTDLGTLQNDWSIATRINDMGLVVGYSELEEGSGLLYGFRWSNGAMTQLPVLGTNTNNGANDVNAQGDAVGWSGAVNDVRPVFYPASGGVLDLGSLGGTDSSAFAMNDAGDAVGYSYTPGNQSRHAFVYKDGFLRDLNERIPADSGWELIAATGINDAGRIVGYGCKDSTVVPPSACRDANGSDTFRRAFLLTPVPSIEDLEDLVISLDLPRGLETSLLAKLAAAQRAIDAGRIGTTCNLLATFANEVEAQSGKALTTADADLLLETLRLIQDDLGCT